MIVSVRDTLTSIAAYLLKSGYRLDEMSIKPELEETTLPDAKAQTFVPTGTVTLTFTVTPEE